MERIVHFCEEVSRWVSVLLSFHTWWPARWFQGNKLGLQLHFNTALLPSKHGLSDTYVFSNFVQIETKEM